MNIPDWFKLHLNSSQSPRQSDVSKVAVNTLHATNFEPVRSHLNAIFVGNDSIALATEACLFRTMLYNEGYWTLSGELPNQMSSQNLILEPSFMLKVPYWNRIFFTFIRPD